MNVLLLILLVATFCMTAPAETNTASTAPVALTLADAYALALERSETLGIVASDWRAAEQRHRRARAAAWPELRAQGDATWQDDGGGNSSREDHTASAGLGAGYAIFQGFRTTRLANARGAEADALALDLERQRQLLYQDVADIFYEALARAGERAAIDEQTATLDDRVREIERRVELGRSRRGDLLAAQAQAADIRVADEQTRGLEASALELLAFLTGQPADTLRPVETNTLPAADAVSRFLQHESSRADVRAAEQRVRAAESEARASDGERLGTVRADANWQPLTTPADESEWDLTLRAELPLFDHGVRRADAAERRENVRASELRLARLERSVDHEVRLAAREVSSALAQRAALTEALRASLENADTQRRDYELGRASNLDALAALLQWHVLNRRAAVLDMQTRAAIVRLHVAAGEAPP
jgi:outer membrane protein TolC